MGLLFGSTVPGGDADRTRVIPGAHTGRLGLVAMAARRPPVLLGRAGERRLLRGLFENVRGGQSAVIVIRGEAGVGKTALLQHCVDEADGLRVARIAGIESEMELPFAGLHQLCAPMLDRLDALPEPQRGALRVAFGLASGAPPDRFLVALASLSLLAEVATERPLACLVDDAQWLDAASGQVLGFVARRLLAESVAIVFAVREPSTERMLADLPELQLGGLAEDDARALLATVVPGRIDERVRDRLIAETHGNPLAILELPRELAAAELPGGFGLAGAQALPGRIEESFLRRLEELPHDTRRLLLIAAADPAGDPALLWRAAPRLGVASTALEAAVRAELVDVGAQVRFRHPLVRSAVYRSASAPERRSAHGALADVTDAAVEPDRRAWHRAQATPAPDEEVAAELERSAGRAQSRGGLAAAAAFLGRAADLSTDAPRRSERLLAAAQAHLQAGAFDTALGVLAAAQGGPLDELGRARVDLLHAQIAYAQNRGSDAPELLLRAARTLEPLDARLSRDTHLDAWSAALFAGRLANAAGLADVSRAARLAPAAPDPRPSDMLLDGFALAFTEGRAAAEPLLRRAANAFAGPDVSIEEVLRWGWLATAAAVYAWDHDTCVAIASREVRVARESGALEVLVVALNVLAQAIALGGEFARAARLIAETDAVSEATGARVAPYGALVLEAMRAREPEASRLIAGAIEEATAGGQGTAVQYARWARAVVMNAHGRYEEALAAATEASEDTPELFVSMWALSELVEAATRTGRADLAASALDRLGEHTRETAEPWGRGMHLRARALLADGEAAEPLYREAIERLGHTRLRPEQARARLLYGEWLRRANRRVDAREQLRAAHDAFLRMGADGFAERARHELLATGAKVRRRVDETRDELTPQEEHIARLARDGRTNPQIGAELYISPRTVEWHLNKVFAKLGISSRRGLQDALAAHEREAAPV
jgi:DNA-binding CsgD family transcriptional regulator/tetratricopeptide (TPR) repeat protein